MTEWGSKKAEYRSKTLNRESYCVVELRRLLPSVA